MFMVYTDIQKSIKKKNPSQEGPTVHISLLLLVLNIGIQAERLF